jgi:hypothetical protein
MIAGMEICVEGTEGEVSREHKETHTEGETKQKGKRLGSV